MNIHQTGACKKNHFSYIELVKHFCTFGPCSPVIQNTKSRDYSLLCKEGKSVILKKMSSSSCNFVLRHDTSMNENAVLPCTQINFYGLVTDSNEAACSL